MEDPKSKGFIINPYDTCVVNIIVNGNQKTITWHVDDLKILHVDADELKKIIYWMKGIYSSHTKECRGKKNY